MLIVEKGRKKFYSEKIIIVFGSFGVNELASNALFLHQLVSASFLWPLGISSLSSSIVLWTNLAWMSWLFLMKFSLLLLLGFLALDRARHIQFHLHFSTFQLFKTKFSFPTFYTIYFVKTASFSMIMLSWFCLLSIKAFMKYICLLCVGGWGGYKQSLRCVCPLIFALPLISE